MLKSLLGDRHFYRRVLRIAVPIFLQNIITNFVSLLDNLMVGQLGTLPMSGVAIVNQLLFVFNLVVFGVSTGTGIFTAQFYGQGNQTGVQQTMRFKVVASVLFSGLFLAAFWLFDDALIRWFLTGEGSAADAAAILDYGKEYLLIMLIGLVPFALSSCYASTLRECGDTLTPMISSFAAMFCNLILNYILIFGHFGAPAMGAAGAAVATVISRYLELAIMAYWTHRNTHKFTFAKGLYRSLYIPRQLMKQMLGKVTPLILNETFWSIAITFQTQCYSTCGLMVVSALNIVSTINNIAIVVSTAMGNTTGILMGQMIGARCHKEEILTENRRLMFFSFLSGAVFSVFLICVARAFPNFYNTSQEIRTLSAGMIVLMSLSKPFQCYHVSIYYTIRAGGLVFWTLLYDCGYLWLFVVPLTFVMCHFSGLPFLAIYGVCLLSEPFKAVFGTILLKKTHWIKDLTVS